MSTLRTIIIPGHISLRLSDPQLRAIEQILKRVGVGDLEIECSTTARFVTCGQNFHWVLCPRCFASVETDRWGDAVQHVLDTSADPREVTMPEPLGCGCSGMLVDELVCWGEQGFAFESVAIVDRCLYLPRALRNHIEQTIEMPIRVVSQYL